MSINLKKITFCSLALLMGCSVGISSLNPINANASRKTHTKRVIHNTFATKQTQKIRYVHKTLLKMGLKNKQAVALTAVALEKNPSLNKAVKQINNIKYHKDTRFTPSQYKMGIRVFNEQKGSTLALMHWIANSTFGLVKINSNNTINKKAIAKVYGTTMRVNLQKHHTKKIVFKRATKHQIKLTYQKYLKMGLHRKQAKALTAVALHTDGNLRGTTKEQDGTNNGGYGYYQFMYLQMKRVAKKNHQNVNTLAFQTKFLFAHPYNNLKDYRKGIRKFNHEKGSTYKLAKDVDFFMNNNLPKGLTHANVHSINYVNSVLK